MNLKAILYETLIISYLIEIARLPASHIFKILKLLNYFVKPTWVIFCYKGLDLSGYQWVRLLKCFIIIDLFVSGRRTN